MTRTFVWAKFRKGRESRKRYSTCGFRFFHVPSGTTEGLNGPVPRLWGKPSEFRLDCDSC